MNKLPYIGYLVLMLFWGFLRKEFIGLDFGDWQTWVLSFMLVIIFFLGRWSVRTDKDSD